MLTIPEELRALIVPRAEPVPLEGTTGQVAYGESVRRSMLSVARRYHPELVDMLMCVRDATWFLGNKTRQVGQLRWPSPAQLSPTDGESPSTVVGCGMFETRNPPGANPRGLRESEVRRSVGDFRESPAGLDPVLEAPRKN